MGVEQYVVLRQLRKPGILRDHDIVQRRMADLARIEYFMLTGPGQAPVPVVHLGIPDVVIVPEHSDLRPVGGSGDIGDGGDATVDVFDLRQLSIVPIIIVEDAVPIDLRTLGHGAPPEEADVIRSVGDALHGPQLDLARLRGRRFHSGIPSVGARLLLHDPEMRAD